MIEYNGVKIEVSTTTGKFTAVAPDGTVLVKTSLQAVQRALDQVKAFKSFTAYVQDGFRGSKNPYKQVTVVGIKPPTKRRCDGRTEWRVVDKRGQKDTHLQVYADTPANLAALLAYDTLEAQQDKEISALRERHRREREQASKKIVVLTPPEKGKK